MSKTIKTLLGTMLCLCLMLGVMLGLSVSASAEETKTGYGVTIDGTETLYTDYATAVNAAESAESATITLYQEASGSFWYESGTITLDLNGFTSGRLCIDGCDLTVIDTSDTKGTILNQAGAAVQFHSGRLTIDASVDCTGEFEGHEAWQMFKAYEITDVVTIGSTGTENIVLPEGLVAVYTSPKTETTVLDGNVIPHRHSWTEGDCVTPDTCSGCDTTIAAPGHSKGESEGVVTAPTCTEDGYTTYTCTVCGESYTADPVPNTGHSDGEGVVTAPTCTEDGYTTYTCTVCGESYTADPVPNTGHSDGEGVVTAPTCTEDGYTTYTCIVCGESYTADSVPATGHSYGENGICTVCGHDKDNTIVINMTDSYGDSWTGNAINIYADGKLVGTATIDDGYEATWSGDYYPDKKYLFCWATGSYPEECSFEILICGEVVCTASGNEFSDGDLIYPKCEHSYGEAVVTPPTCTEDGYTTYTCTSCGWSYTANWIIGKHTLGDDGNCTVCGELYTVPVWVGDVQIDGNNLTDILGDADEGATAYYDVATNTLTLNGFDYEGEMEGIYSEIPMNIVLLGENFIATDYEGIYFDINGGVVTISGTGSLDIYSLDEGIYVGDLGDVKLILSGSVTIDINSNNDEGIYLNAVNADLLIKDNVKLTIGTEDDPVREECIYVVPDINGSLTITGNAEVNVCTTDEEGIYVSGNNSQSIIISGNASVNVVGDEEGLDANTITISGGTLNLIGGSGNEGIYCDNLTITGGTVYAEGGEQGIEVNDTIIISGGMVIAVGSDDYESIYADELIISGGNLKVVNGGVKIQKWDYVAGNYVPGNITLSNVTIKMPEGSQTGMVDVSYATILNADGSVADSFTITDGKPFSGVYFVNGAWYYYENGKIGYNKGMIDVDTTWYGADGSETEYSGYIYVRSNGKLATGAYYITNVENDDSDLFESGQKVIFDENGMIAEPKDGIVDVNGTLYYYENNQIAYNLGLIEYNGGWIYVRSNGKVATGAYWITNTNGEMEQGYYDFGTDGYMVITDAEDGIVEENGVLFYYEGSKKLYGVGLKQLSDGSYIYIRTNGQLAVGSYWITNHNGLLPEGMYTFGEDGILIEN